MQRSGLDEKDNQILNLLLKDGRMSYSEIGSKIGMSRTAAKKRVHALEERGIIKGYQAVVDSQSMPGKMIFVTHNETRAEDFEACKQYLTQVPAIVTLVHTTGNCHLMAICIAPDIQTMRAFINYTYNTVQGILSINAHAVLDIIKGSVLPTIK